MTENITLIPMAFFSRVALLGPLAVALSGCLLTLEEARYRDADPAVRDVVVVDTRIEEDVRRRDVTVDAVEDVRERDVVRGDARDAADGGGSVDADVAVDGELLDGAHPDADAPDGADVDVPGDSDAGMDAGIDVLDADASLDAPDGLDAVDARGDREMRDAIDVRDPPDVPDGIDATTVRDAIDVTDSADVGRPDLISVDGPISSDGFMTLDVARDIVVDVPVTCPTACSTDETCCNGTCVSLQRSEENCGSCGTSCGSGLICRFGRCQECSLVGLSVCTASGERCCALFALCIGAGFLCTD